MFLKHIFNTWINLLQCHFCRSSNFFAIHNKTGKISIQKKPPTSAGVIELVVLAEDLGSPPLQSSAQILVNFNKYCILERKDKPFGVFFFICIGLSLTLELTKFKIFKEVKIAIRIHSLLYELRFLCYYIHYSFV